MWVGLQVSGQGLQAVGQWPAFETLENPAELADLLEKLAGLAASDEEEENLRSAAKTVRSKAPDILRGFTSAALQAAVRSQLGVGA